MGELEFAERRGGDVDEPRAVDPRAFRRIRRLERGASGEDIARRFARFERERRRLQYGRQRLQHAGPHDALDDPGVPIEGAGRQARDDVALVDEAPQAAGQFDAEPLGEIIEPHGGLAVGVQERGDARQPLQASRGDERQRAAQTVAGDPDMRGPLRGAVKIAQGALDGGDAILKADMDAAPGMARREKARVAQPLAEIAGAAKGEQRDVADPAPKALDIVGGEGGDAVEAFAARPGPHPAGGS